MRRMMAVNTSRPVTRFLLLVFVMAGLFVPGHVTAQEPLPPVTIFIGRVEVAQFPFVDVHLTVTDQSGLPLVDLSGDDFLVVEDNQTVPPENVVAQSELAQELRLVVALDLSTSPENLASMQAAAKTLINSLNPRDRAAIVTFDDVVEQVYDLTNNQTELNFYLDTLSRQGTSTRLYDAALESVNVLSQQPGGRKGVILLTDRDDTGSTATLEAVIEQARTGGVPLYVLGFGSGVDAGLLETMAESTGGRGLKLNTAAELVEEMQTLAVLLRQGYKVTFQSELQADSTAHDLVIELQNAAQGSRAGTAQFPALPSEVQVTLPSLSPGQNVQGEVRIIPQIKSNAPVAQVTYFLDNQVLEMISTPPFAITWNSAIPPLGLHELRVTVVDEAGNSGEVELELNAVPAALEVEAQVLQDNIRITDQVDIVATVSPASEVARVDFFLDDVLLGVDNAEPYAFSFNTADYSAGPHVVTVRARGSLGQQGVVELAVPFQETSWLTVLGYQLGYEGDLAQDWPRLLARTTLILIGLALILTIVLVTLALTRRMVTALRRIPTSKKVLKVYNVGNVRSRYWLRAEEATGLLDLVFVGPKGKPLLPAEIPELAPAPALASQSPVVGRTGVQPSPVAAQRPGAMATPAPASSRGGNGAGGNGAGVDVKGAGKKAKGAVGASQTIADIMFSIGEILPGSLGNSLMNQAAAMRQANAGAAAAVAKPQQVTSTVQQAQTKAGKLTPAAAKSSGVAASAGLPAQPAAAGQAYTPPAAAVAGGYQQPTAEAAEAGYPAQQPAQVATSYLASHWVQTPEIAPGDHLAVGLLITPTDRTITRDCVVRVVTKAVEAEMPQPETIEQKFPVRAMSIFRRVLLPLFLSLLLALIAVVVILPIAYFVINFDVTALPVIGPWIT